MRAVALPDHSKLPFRLEGLSMQSGTPNAISVVVSFNPTLAGYPATQTSE